MTYLANPRHYGREDFRAYVDSLTWSKGWRPAFPTLHNTGVPSLAQWLGYGATAQDRWGANLNRYYEGLGWHAGPHLVCCPDYIWVLCDPEADGVSVSCWNRVTFGIEMVGDYRAGGDDPATGEGAKVIDNAVFALAVLANRLKWQIGNVEEGLTGLHFHRECARDAHACPGDLVNKSDIIGRVVRMMTTLDAKPVPAPVPSAPGVSKVLPPDPTLAAARQLRAAVEAFQTAVNLPADGDPGPQTRAVYLDALKRA